MSKHHWQELLCQIPSAELEKLAILRVLECSNGMIQLRFREGHPDALNVDDTRKAMQFSMRCIKAMEIPLGDEIIRFDSVTQGLLQEIRTLYVDGIKRNDSASRSEFFRASRANLEAIGHERLERAQRRLFADCYDLPVHTLDWGMDYINDFLTPAHQTRSESGPSEQVPERSKS